MHSVTITGFKTTEEANQFMSWFSEQGEQDIDIWLECAKDRDLIDCDSMRCEMYKIDDYGNGHMTIETH